MRILADAILAVWDVYLRLARVVRYGIEATRHRMVHAFFYSCFLLRSAIEDSPFSFVLDLSYHIKEFAVHWLFTRSWKSFLFGLPALVCGLLLVYVSWIIPHQNQLALIYHYRDAIRMARLQRDYDSLAVCEKKLAQLGSITEGDAYNTALAAADQDVALAYDRMKRISPQTVPGYPLGHLWISTMSVSNILPFAHHESLNVAQTHIRRLEELGAESDSLHFLKGLLSAKAGDTEAAAKYFKKIKQQDPAVLVELAKLEAAVGKTDASQSLADTAVNLFENSLQDSTEIDLPNFFYWFSSAQLAKRANSVRNMMSKQLLLPEALSPRILEDTFVRMYDETDRTDVTIENRFLLLEKALGFFPNSDRLLERMIMLAAEDDSAESKSLQFIERIDFNNEIRYPILHALSHTYFDRRNYDVSIRYFEQLLQITPENHEALNNLAWLLLAKKPDRLDEALALADQAIALAPANYHYRHTRAFILYAQEDWQTAVDELEDVLTRMPDDVRIHRRLALAYKQLGNSEKHEWHFNLSVPD
ncbi:MAG: tetratricopeptide repeat protein [Planctomycetales bacterium]|nr:tetratricopeptide repeat protein [Planctomycetales bacterium]